MSVTEQLNILLANTYALYLKTQNYHWHVKGLHFKSLHGLFEEQYLALAEAVDEIAERIRILGDKAPATFSEFNELKTLSDGSSDYDPSGMLTDLGEDHQKIIEMFNESIELASKNHDEGSVALFSERIAAHEKMRWMLEASQA
jgi:starvation-inducible DNA-binding protein